MSRLPSVLLTSCLILALAASALLGRARLPNEDLQIVQDKWPDAVITPTGLRYVVLKESDGQKVRRGDRLAVRYKGSLLDGSVFDESREDEPPFEFVVGQGDVIRGWDQALAQMSVGEKRLLIVPHELGYGSLGMRPAIPPRATLIFEVELVEILPRAPRR